MVPGAVQNLPPDRFLFQSGTDMPLSGYFFDSDAVILRGRLFPLHLPQCPLEYKHSTELHK